MIATEKHHVGLLPVFEKAFPLAQKVMMCRPDFFEIVTIKNVHMNENIGKSDSEVAAQQWKKVKQTFVDCGLDVFVMEPARGLDDMVFTANHGLVFLDEKNRKKVVLSKMFAHNRQGEIPPFGSFMAKNGYEEVNSFMDDDDFFEGMGDTIWHRGKKLLIAGYGHRSTFKGLEKVAHAINVPAAALRLVNDRFYHLDTCLSVLDEESALVVPDAFDELGLELLQSIFPRLLGADLEEAEKRLAANAFCPNNREVIINKGCPKTCRLLKENGFIPIEVDTGEFGKSGGSVSCMKLAFW